MEHLQDRLPITLVLLMVVSSTLFAYPTSTVYVIKTVNFKEQAEVRLPELTKGGDITFGIFIPNVEKYNVHLVLANGKYIDLVKLYEDNKFLNKYMKLILKLGKKYRERRVGNYSLELILPAKPTRLVFGSKLYKSILYFRDPTFNGKRINLCGFTNATCYSLKVPVIAVKGIRITMNMPVGPVGTNSYRDLRPLHLPDGTIVRINGWFYAVAKNVRYSYSHERWFAKGVLLRSKDFVNWQIVGTLPLGGSCDIVLLNESSGLLVYNPSQMYIFKLNDINCPSKWQRVKIVSDLLKLPQYRYIAVAYLYYNATDKRLYVAGEQEYTISYGPSLLGLDCPYSCKLHVPFIIDYTHLVAHTPIWPKSKPKCLTPLVSMWEYGMKTPNPMVFYWKSKNTYLIVTNPIPRYFVLLPVIGILHGKDYIPLPPGTWIFNYGVRLNNRHETAELVTTQKAFDEGKFWIIWWHNKKGYHTYTYELLKSGNLKPRDFPNINVKFSCTARVLKFEELREKTDIGQVISSKMARLINFVKTHKELVIISSLMYILSLLLVAAIVRSRR